MILQTRSTLYHQVPVLSRMFSSIPASPSRLKERGGAVDACAILHTTVLSPGWDVDGGPVYGLSSLGHPDVCGGQCAACLPRLVSHYIHYIVLLLHNIVLQYCDQVVWWRTSVCVPSSLAIKMCGGQHDACLPYLVSHHVHCIVDTGIPHSQLIFWY